MQSYPAQCISQVNMTDFVIRGSVVSCCIARWRGDTSKSVAIGKGMPPLHTTDTAVACAIQP